MDRGKEAPAVEAVGCGNNSIANKYSFKERMKNSLIFKLIINKTGHKPTQYNKVIDTLPVLCADKNYQGLADVILNGINLVEADFTQSYLDTDRWSITHHVEIRTVNQAKAAAANGSRTPTITMARKTHIFDANIQKQLLSEFKQNFKIKAQEFSKIVADKKVLIMIILGQCDEATKTEIALGAN